MIYLRGLFLRADKVQLFKSNKTIIARDKQIDRYLLQVRAGQGCPAGSSRGTSAGQGFSGHGRWGGCAAARRCDQLIQCLP